MILVRHALPEIDPRFPPVEWPLSSAGRSQVIALAERLGPHKPDAIGTSPEPKARQTAEILGTALGLDVAVVSELREHERNGAPFLHLPGEFEENVRRLFAFPLECTFGNESAADALARFQCGMARVIDLGARQPIVVTHGTVMSLYIGAEFGLDPFSIWKQMGMPCYSVLHRIERQPFEGVLNLDDQSGERRAASPP